MKWSAKNIGSTCINCMVVFLWAELTAWKLLGGSVRSNLIKKWLQNLLSATKVNFKSSKHRQNRSGRTRCYLICLKGTAKASSNLKRALTIIHSWDMIKFLNFRCKRHSNTLPYRPKISIRWQYKTQSSKQSYSTYLTLNRTRLNNPLLKVWSDWLTTSSCAIWTLHCSVSVTLILCRLTLCPIVMPNT
jgi:hypothetical protein